MEKQPALLQIPSAGCFYCVISVINRQAALKSSLQTIFPLYRPHDHHRPSHCPIATAAPGNTPAAATHHRPVAQPAHHARWRPSAARTGSAMAAVVPAARTGRTGGLPAGQPRILRPHVCREPPCADSAPRNRTPAGSRIVQAACRRRAVGHGHGQRHYRRVRQTGTPRCRRVRQRHQRGCVGRGAIQRPNAQSSLHLCPRLLV